MGLSGAPCFRLHPVKTELAFWKLVSSHSSATVPDFHRVPHAASHLPAGGTRIGALFSEQDSGCTDRTKSQRTGCDFFLRIGQYGKKKSDNGAVERAVIGAPEAY
jgi:hypothetical protein